MLMHLTPANWTRRKKAPKSWTYETVVGAGFTDVSVLMQSRDASVFNSASLVVKDERSTFRILAGSAVAQAAVTQGDLMIVEAVEPPDLLRLYFSQANDRWPLTASILPKSMQGHFSSHKRAENFMAELAKRLENNDLAGAVAIHCMARRNGASEDKCTASAQLILQKMVDKPLLRDPALGAFIIAQTLSLS